MAIDATWAGSGSNAYVSLTDAESYITTSLIDPSVWTDATTAKRQAALLQASIDVDANQYIGARYVYYQKLEIPRRVDSNFPYNYTVIGSVNNDEFQRKMQDDVKRATCHQAVWRLELGDVSKHQKAQIQGIKSWKEDVGPISESVDYGNSATGSSRKNTLHPTTRALLSPYLTTRKIYRG